jgi:hypothetical protein
MKAVISISIFRLPVFKKPRITQIKVVMLARLVAQSKSDRMLLLAARF